MLNLFFKKTKFSVKSELEFFNERDISDLHNNIVAKTNSIKSEREFFNATHFSDIHNINIVGETRHYTPPSKQFTSRIFFKNKYFTNKFPIVKNTIIKPHLNTQDLKGIILPYHLSQKLNLSTSSCINAS